MTENPPHPGRPVLAWRRPTVLAGAGLMAALLAACAAPAAEAPPAQTPASAAVDAAVDEAQASPVPSGLQGLAMQDAEAIYFGLPAVAAYDLAGQGTTAASGERYAVDWCDSISVLGVITNPDPDPVYSYLCVMDLAGEHPIATMNLTSGYLTSVFLLVTDGTTLECVSVTPDGESAEAGHYSAADGAAPGGCS